MYEQLSARGSAAASGARDAARASRSAYYDNPLVGGFVAALLGAVAGAVIPASQKEEDYLGDTGAKVLDTAEEKARTLGNEALAQNDEVVQRAEENMRSEEHTSELQSLMRISYAVFCLHNTPPPQPTSSITTHYNTSNT